MTNHPSDSRSVSSYARFASVALLMALFAPAGTALAQESGGTCVDSCGDQSPDGCWCDAVCTQAGDCCEDFNDVCDADNLPPPPFTPIDPEQPPLNPEGTCSDSCGGFSPDGCWCDAQCTEIGDCCNDFNDVCDADNLPPPPLTPIDPEQPPVNPEGTCSDSCGGASPDGCWCDAQCTELGDCCNDYGAVCSE